MTLMRAKMRVTGVEKNEDNSETLTFTGVARDDNYPEDGSDENNTFAKFTPCADLSMLIQNPALWGQLKANDTFYLDFTKVE